MAELITLPEAAELLGVHYMTVYRYVRTGRLPATKVGAEYRVDPADLEATRATPATRNRRRRTDWATRVEERLLAGDEAGAWAIIEDALTSGVEPTEIHLRVLSPALASIGDRWASGEVTVADEHQASAVALRVIGRLGPRFTRRGRKRGTVVIGAAPHDQHGLPAALLGDLLRARGFAVVDLGADTPAASWGEAAAGAERLVAVAISVTTEGNDRNVRAAVRAVRSAADAPVMLGGRAIADAARAEALGADLHGASGEDAVAKIDALATGRSVAAD